MTQSELDKIKNEALVDGLFQKCSRILFEARQNIEDSAKNGYDRFYLCIGNARELLDDAEQIQKEVDKIRVATRDKTNG
jgi:hypothetical protein